MRDFGFAIQRSAVVERHAQARYEIRERIKLLLSRGRLAYHLLVENASAIDAVGVENVLQDLVTQEIADMHRTHLVQFHICPKTSHCSVTSNARSN